MIYILLLVYYNGTVLIYLVLLPGRHWCKAPPLVATYARTSLTHPASVMRGEHARGAVGGSRDDVVMLCCHFSWIAAEAAATTEAPLF